MRDLEEIVGAAVRDLAADAPRPYDLAAAARGQGRRIRRRRRAAIGTAALALVLVAAGPFVLFREKPPVLPTMPSPEPSQKPSAVTLRPAPEGDWWKQPHQLPGGLIVTALTRNDVGQDRPAGTTVRDGNVILDRLAGSYRAIRGDFYTIWGSPAGSTAVVSDGSSNLLAVEGKGNATRPVVSGFILDPQWSPDGTRVLTSGLSRYTIWNAASGESTTVDATEARSTCPDYCFFTWLPNGREIALARADPAVPQSEAEPDTVKDVVVYNAKTGKKLRTLPVPGVPIGPDAWSPDGRLVLVMDESFSGDPALVADTRTGKILGAIPGRNVHFLPDGRILSIREGEIASAGGAARSTGAARAEVYDTTGTLLEAQALPDDFAGRTVSVGRP